MILPKKIITLTVFFLYYCLRIFCAPQQTEIHIKYTKNYWNSFLQGNFSHSLFNLYCLAHYYNDLKDSSSLSLTWSRISVLNYLSDKKYHGYASYKIAGNYKKIINNYKYICCAYDEKDNNPEKSLQYLRLITESEDSFIIKATKYLEVNLYFNEFGKSRAFNPLIYNSTLQKIQLMEDSKDTLWFGYGFINYFLGIQDFYNLKYLESNNHMVKAIHTYEKLGCYNYQWLNSYFYIIYTGYYVSKNLLAQYYFTRLNSIYNNGKIEKNLISYYFGVKGIYYSLTSNYTEANDAMLMGINAKGKFGQTESIIYFLTYSYYIMKEYDKVIEWFEKYKNIINDDYYTSIAANSYLKTGNNVLAAKYIKIAIDRLNKRSDNLISSTFLVIARYYFEAGDLEKAEIYYYKYLNSVLRVYGKYHKRLSNACENLAYFYWVKGDIEKSIIYYQNDICNITQVPYNDNFFRLPDISKSIDDDLLTDALKNQADVFFEYSKMLKSEPVKRRYIEASLSFFELALKVATRYKFSIFREDKKLKYTEYINKIYPKIIEICFALYKETNNQSYIFKAFEYAEKNKASLLLSMVRGSDARKLSMIPETVTKKEDSIQKSTDKYLKLLAEESNKYEPSQALIEEFNTQLQFLNHEQDSMLKIIKEKYSSYYNARYNADVIPIDSLRKLLHANQVAILYSLSNRDLLIFLVSKTEFKFWQNKIDNSFIEDITRYRNFVSKYSFDNTKETSIYSFADLSFKLYKNLIKPLNKYINGKDLIIIPDGELNTIPFETLITDSVGHRNRISYRELPYLIRQNSINYNYSATLYAYTCRNSKIVYQNPKLLAVAPLGADISISEIPENNISETRKDSNIIIPIPGTLDEVKNIHKIFRGKLLLKGKASELNFLKHAGKFDILHIASHGIVNNGYPLFSKLVFSTKIDTSGDGLLNTYEIYNMDITAPLVVLSACNTGYGKIYKGEGIISLARGFFIAGAQNVLMTQWAIADKTSNKLMRNFYKFLSEKNDVSNALRNAKTEYLATSDEISSHPYFWAGYVSAGNPSVTFSKSKFNFYIKYRVYILTGVLLVLALLFFKKKLF